MSRKNENGGDVGNNKNNINKMENTININSNQSDSNSSEETDSTKKIEPLNEIIIEINIESNELHNMEPSSINTDLVQEESLMEMFDKLLEEVNEYIRELNENEESNTSLEFNYDEEFKQLDELDQLDEMINEKYYELTGHLDCYYNMLQDWNSVSFNLFMDMNETKEKIDNIKEIISASNEFLEVDAINIRNEIDQLMLEFDVVYENALLEIREKNDTWTEYILQARKDDILYKKEVLYLEFERYIWFVEAFKEYLERHKIRKWSYLWSKSNCSFN